MRWIELKDIFDDSSPLPPDISPEGKHIVDEEEKVYHILDLQDSVSLKDYKILDRLCEKLDYSCKLYTSNMYWFLTGEKFPLQLDCVEYDYSIFKTFFSTYTNGHGIIDEEIKQKLINRNRRFDFCAVSSNVGSRESKQLFFKRVIEENLWNNGLISCPEYPRDLPINNNQVFEGYIPAGIDIFPEEGPIRPIPRSDWKTHYNFEFEKATDIGGKKIWNTRNSPNLRIFHKAFMINGEIYRNSFVEVVLESSSISLDVSKHSKDLSDKYWRVSEKTMKALFTLPFIVVGPSHTLYYLKQLGFKTHSHIFDESYDEIINMTERVEFVIQELKKFCSLSYTEKQRKFVESLDIIEHNQKVGYDYVFNKGKKILPSLLYNMIKDKKGE